MRPAFSVVFLTTLIGAGQGLLLALVAGEWGMRHGGVRPELPREYFVLGSALAVTLTGLGLVASFFHLGRPERAWRAAAMWRTSWLSREVIALPLFMALATAYGAAHYAGWPLALAIGLAAVIACFALFFCTAMIYACVKFLQEWASPLTIANFMLMGCASGFTLAVPLVMAYQRTLAWRYATLAILLTAAALAVRLVSLARNANIVHRSTLQSAIGVDHPRIRQVSQGFTGESFNTQEFMHGVGAGRMELVRAAFVLLAFVAPIGLVVAGLVAKSPAVLASAFVVQFAGLLCERWYFLAQASHPQNLYYQNRS
jgi:DMSO reductase anchor subunit